MLLLAFLLLAIPVQASLVNRTIDDELGDSETGVLPIYAPRVHWRQGATCPGCYASADIDPTYPYRGTWHDLTHGAGGEDINITVTFTGTAVYLYHIILNTVLFMSDTALEFYLDGEHVGKFTHFADSSGIVQYDVPVYVNTTLNNTAHTLLINTTDASSLILFDYIVYTVDDTSDSLSLLSSSTSSTTSAPQTPSTTSSPSSTSIVISSTSSTTSSWNLTVVSSVSSTTPDVSTVSLTTVTQHYPSTTSISPSNISSAIAMSHSASPSPSPRGRPSTSLGAVIGGATVAGIAVVFVVFVGVGYLRRRAGRRRWIHIVDKDKPDDDAISSGSFVIESERLSQSVLNIGFSSPLQEAQYRARSEFASEQSSGALATVGMRNSANPGHRAMRALKRVGGMK